MADGVINALLVDDASINIGPVTTWLADVKGIHLVQARGLTDASVHLRQRHFDVVLLPCNDADNSDISPIEWLHDHASSVPIVVISDVDDANFTYQAIRQGAQDVLLLTAETARCLRPALLTSIERKRLEQHRISHARKDELTGLANQLLLEERFERAIARADRQATLVGLVAIDLDQTDMVIDRYGLATLNRLLPMVGQRFMTEIRQTDTLARTREGGFTWLVEGLAAINDISKLVERLPILLAAPFSIDHRDIQVTASVGVAICPFHGRDFQSVHAMAEAAMLDVTTMNGDALLMLPLPAIAEGNRSGALT